METKYNLMYSIISHDICDSNFPFDTTWSVAKHIVAVDNEEDAKDLQKIILAKYYFIAKDYIVEKYGINSIISSNLREDEFRIGFNKSHLTFMVHIDEIQINNDWCDYDFLLDK